MRIEEFQTANGELVLIDTAAVEAVYVGGEKLTVHTSGGHSFSLDVSELKKLKTAVQAVKARRPDNA